MRCRQMPWLAVILVTVSPCLHAQTSKLIGLVEITSTSSGVRQKKAHVLIQKEGGVYRLADLNAGAVSGSGNTAVVDSKLIDALSGALQETANAGPTSSDLSITPEWLKANASIYTHGNISIHPAPTPAQEATFEKLFVDPAEIDSLLPELYQRWHTDDYTDVRVLTTLEDGTVIACTSHSQHAFMLPWSREGGRSGSFYNADISRAVAALMPDKSANQPRLAGDGLAFDLARLVMDKARVESQKEQTTEVEEKAGSTLAVLRTKFTVDRAAMGPDDEDEAWPSATSSSDLALHLRLSSIHFPNTSFKESVVLSYRDGRVVGLDDFLSRERQLESVLFSIPWLDVFLGSFSSPPVTLSYVRNASLTTGAMDAFADDMHGVGKDDLASEVRAVKERTALLIVGHMRKSYWLVLPDKRTILWRYDELAPLLQWKPSDFTFKPCAAQPVSSGGCAGTVILPSGSLQGESGAGPDSGHP